MQNSHALRIFFKLSSILTDRFPSAGSRALDWFTFSTIGNAFILKAQRRSAIRQLRYVNDPKRILVVADLNIGDAVNLQAAFTALREFFPTARLDYVIADCAKSLVMGNPEITRVYSIFTGRPLPNALDREALRRITTDITYDVIFNFCPFLDERRDFNQSSVVIGYAGMAHAIAHDQSLPEHVNHVAYQAHRSVRDLLAEVFVPLRKSRFKGVRVTLTHSAITRAQEFLSSIDEFQGETSLIYFNPDASSIFTRVPIAFQVSILKALAAKQDSRILLGRGHTFRAIETEILDALPVTVRNRIAMVPVSLGLDGIAALIDSCDAYIGGDSGPLHIAACTNIQAPDYSILETKRQSTPSSVQRRRAFTAMIPDASVIFPLINAPKAGRYVAKSPCRNMTCINKRAKTCAQVRCFSSLNTTEIIHDVVQNLPRPQRTFATSAVA